MRQTNICFAIFALAEKLPPRAINDDAIEDDDDGVGN